MMSVEWVVSMVMLGFVLGYIVRKRVFRQKQKSPHCTTVSEAVHNSLPGKEMSSVPTFRRVRKPRIAVTVMNAHSKGNGVYETTPYQKTAEVVAQFHDPKLQMLFSKGLGGSLQSDASCDEKDQRGL